MPLISDLYSSKHLKPADLGGRPATVTIKEVTVEAFQNDGDNVRKAVLQFDPNIIKPLVVNKTNYLILAHAYGANTDAWIERQIVLSPSMTPFKGKWWRPSASSHYSRGPWQRLMALANHTTRLRKSAGWTRRCRSIRPRKRKPAQPRRR
jgi:hypothetical protein